MTSTTAIIVKIARTHVTKEGRKKRSPFLFECVLSFTRYQVLLSNFFIVFTRRTSVLRQFRRVRGTFSFWEILKVECLLNFVT